jgi:thiol:disulfide interchange protein DsbA
MQNRRRTLLAALALAPLLARAQEPRRGSEYTVLAVEQPVEAQGKVEVVEFFWYGCPTCYKFEPLLEAWVKKLPADAQFRRVPAVFSERWARDASVYFAFEALGLVERLHGPFFDAIHRDRLQPEKPEALGEWLERNKVDRKRFDDAIRSFGVQSKVRRAAQMSGAYKLEGVPTLAVHGRYTIQIEQGRGFEGMLQIAEYLIGVTRKSLTARK